MSALISRTGSRFAVGSRLRGLTWLTWRQHRAAFGAAAVLFLLVVSYFVWQRAELSGFVDRYDITSCRGRGCDTTSGSPATTLPDNMQQAVTHFKSEVADPLSIGGYVLLVLPALVGVFIGAPLVARERENGTYKLAWSQSYDPERWLAHQLALLAAVTAVMTGLLAAVYRWWWVAVNDTVDDFESYYASNVAHHDWSAADSFFANGPVLVAVALLALVLGTASGLLLRRILPAMAVALAGTVGAQFLLARMLPHVMPPETVYAKTTQLGDTQPWNTWWQDDDTWEDDGAAGFLLRSGRHVREGACSDKYIDDNTLSSCLTDNDVVKQWAEIHPYSHYWPLQWIETGICLVAAAALTLFCLRRIRHRP
ncbi:translation initiation factor IF-2 [Streptomyces sp. 3N207]|uniref:translation initiation factor IF-2 n=1 Tax=Streptomyces sp. 3N207 TaxID=3457417 RepID=UPI003FD2BA16